MASDEHLKSAPQREQPMKNVLRIIARTEAPAPPIEHKLPHVARLPQERTITDNDDDPGPTAA
jgi:hypothetical protein